jgi:hypothetical protein
MNSFYSETTDLLEPKHCTTQGIFLSSLLAFVPVISDKKIDMEMQMDA